MENSFINNIHYRFRSQWWWLSFVGVFACLFWGIGHNYVNVRQKAFVQFVNIIDNRRLVQFFPRKSARNKVYNCTWRIPSLITFTIDFCLFVVFVFVLVSIFVQVSVCLLVWVVCFFVCLLNYINVFVITGNITILLFARGA